MPDLCFTKDWRLKACSVRSMVSVFSNVLKCEDLAYVEINNYCMRHWFYWRVFPSSGQRQFCRHPHTHTEREREVQSTHTQTNTKRERAVHTHTERGPIHTERERESEAQSTHKEIERAVHTHTHTQSRHEWISAPGRHFDFYSLNGTNHMKICNALCCAQH